MHRTRLAGIALLAASYSCFLVSPSLVAQDSPTKTDNSKVNKTEHGKISADGQKNNKSDVQITADIRKSIVGEKSLSTYAHNVKIVTRGGMVTLNGPVRTDEEKTSVEAKAKEVAGADKVTSKITVVPKKGKTMKSAS